MPKGYSREEEQKWNLLGSGQDSYSGQNSQDPRTSRLIQWGEKIGVKPGIFLLAAVVLRHSYTRGELIPHINLRIKDK